MGTGEGAAGRSSDDDAAPPETAVLVPDDARALESDRLALLQELRTRSRRDRHQRLLRTRLPARRRERSGPSGSLVALVLLLVALVASLAVILTPRATPRPPAVPLADATTAPGQVGGLLPDEPLELLPGRLLPARQVRPAALALVPVGCDCPRALAHILRAAEQYRLRLWLVGAPAQRLELAELSRRSANAVAIGTAIGTASGTATGTASGLAPGLAGVAIDPAGAFRAFLPLGSGTAAGITLVLVHTDGVVGAVLTDVDEQARLEPRLVPLLRPGGRPYDGRGGQGGRGDRPGAAVPS